MLILFFFPVTAPECNSRGCEFFILVPLYTVCARRLLHSALKRSFYLVPGRRDDTELSQLSDCSIFLCLIILMLFFFFFPLAAVRQVSTTKRHYFKYLSFVWLTLSSACLLFSPRTFSTNITVAVAALTVFSAPFFPYICPISFN